MPAHLFCHALREHDPGLAAIESLADLCQTSLTATAIRYAELSEDAVAVVVSAGAVINYCRLSSTMKLLPEITWPKKGDPVPRGTATSRLNADPSLVARADRVEADIDIMDWLGGSRSVRGTEEVIGLGSYGKTLTVLTCPSLVDETYQEDKGDEEENLVESWTPRFHR